MEITMSNIVVFVNYEIKPELRTEYLALMKEVKINIMAFTDISYSVFESNEKSNCFSEVFQCPTRFSFNAFNQLAETSSKLNFLLHEVDKCILNYSHLMRESEALAA
jgi:hypothetical protein